LRQTSELATGAEIGISLPQGERKKLRHVLPKDFGTGRDGASETPFESQLDETVF